MKIDITSPTATTTPADTAAARRGLIVGAGVAGAAALAAKAMLPGTAPQAAATAAAAKPAATENAGYQLTQHVLRYYETTRA